MNETKINDLTFFTFSNLSTDGSTHFVTGRKGGENGNFNLGLKAGPPGQALANRKILSDIIGIQAEGLFIPSQTHSSNVKVVVKGTRCENLEDTDALITNVPGICIAVLSADCVPVLLYDRQEKVVAAIHAGWRGTVARIVQATIKEMKSRFACKGENILAGIGPSICQEVYEVGKEVIDEVEKAFGREADLIKAGVPGKGYPNLWAANKLQLLEEGIPEKNIEVAGICTFSNVNKFFSARKEPEGTGRFAAGILLNQT